MAIKTIGQTQKPARPSEDGRAHTSEGSETLGFVVYAAAALSLLAALIHLWVAPEHFEEWWGYGAFMLISAACQGLFVPLVLRWPCRNPILLAGITGNLFIVTLYVVSYTWGMPFGPTWVPFDPSVAHIESAEALGVAATAAEVGIAVMLIALMEGVQRRWTVNALLSFGVLLWALRFLGILP